MGDGEEGQGQGQEGQVDGVQVCDALDMYDHVTFDAKGSLSLFASYI